MLELSPSLQVAQTLQNRVGNTLGSLQLLSPESQAVATVSAGASSIGTAVLTSIKVGQDKILESTDKVVELLTTQVKIAEESERRARERAAELAKEKQGEGPNVIPIDEGADKGKFKLDKEGMFENLDVGDIAALATAGGLLLKNVARKVIKGGVKGGFYAVLASFLAKPAIDFLEEGILKVDIPEEDEKKLENAIIAGAGAYALAGIPGALVAIGAVGVNSLINYLNGEQEKFSAMDATMLFAGGVGVKLLSAKAVTALTAAGWVKSAGILAAFTATPVLIAAGVAVAIGIAVNELVKFNEDVQSQTLAELEEITNISRKELSKKFAEQKESFLENMNAAGLADLLGFDLTALNKARIGTEQALDQFKDDPKQFDATEQQSIIKSLDAILLMSNEQLSDVLNDKSKTTAVLDTLNAARQLAVAGAFGEERSKKLFGELLKFSSNLQVAAQDVVATNKAAGSRANSLTINLAAGKGDLLELYSNEFMDAKKRYDENIKKIKETEDEILALEDRDFRGSKNPLSEAEEDRLDQLKMDLIKYGTERNIATQEMKRFGAFGLYGEGDLGFKPGQISNMFSDTELQDLIKKALKNELFKIVNTGIAETAALDDNKTGVNVATNLSSNSKKVYEGDVHTGDTNLNVDSHLQTRVHPLYGVA